MPSRSLLALLITITITLNISAQSLIGTWQGTKDGETGTITFDKKGYASFSFAGEKFGGKKFESDGVLMSLKYRTDTSVNPHTIDLVMYLYKDETEVARMLGIYKFESEEAFLLNLDFNGANRPTRFKSDDPNQIMFTKI